ncbi:bifunctional nicotinamidase/pyrazinamidase [Pararhodobacter sp.]|jgi:nicotinamidase/pyrazinamidase|uniref:bifunctional nicotinamidase/pyrazinamidase n=1 Tax=Pararhodobacter sp. TaxID=2127056 RepID=UPI002FDCA99E
MRPKTEALIAIDIQNDFCPGGALAVAQGDAVVAPVNALMAEFPVTILTQDWHPAAHSSFAGSHPGAAPFSQIALPYGKQVLWPAHCVIGTQGAAFHPGLNTDQADLILRKGSDPALDSYSAFFENDRQTATGLEGYLRTRGITTLTFAGLATDFCVAWSALDAARLGFSVTVRTDACRAIDLDGSLRQAMSAMQAAGISLD